MNNAIDKPLVDRVDFNKGDGLVPMIVQHAHDGRILMLGYVDREALLLSETTGDVYFWSRSRQRIWRKGESSGNVLKRVSIALDCDGDTLLCQALPAGPTCHLGTATCFDAVGAADARAPTHPWLNELEALIESRRGADPASSYVAKLLAAAPARRAQKVGEGGVETALAAVSGDIDELRGEAADLVFHLLVLLHGAGLSFADVVAELAARHRK